MSRTASVTDVTVLSICTPCPRFEVVARLGPYPALSSKVPARGRYHDGKRCDDYRGTVPPRADVVDVCPGAGPPRLLVARSAGQRGRRVRSAGDGAPARRPLQPGLGLPPRVARRGGGRRRLWGQPRPGRPTRGAVHADRGRPRARLAAHQLV